MGRAKVCLSFKLDKLITKRKIKSLIRDWKKVESGKIFE